MWTLIGVQSAPHPLQPYSLIKMRFNSISILLVGSLIANALAVMAFYVAVGMLDDANYALYKERQKPPPVCDVQAMTDKVCMAWWFGDKPEKLAVTKKRFCGK